MDKSEIHKLQAFLRRTFGNDDLRVAVNPRAIVIASTWSCVT